jgi:hypothetical protein
MEIKGWKISTMMKNSNGSQVRVGYVAKKGYLTVYASSLEALKRKLK